MSLITFIRDLQKIPEKIPAPGAILYNAIPARLLHKPEYKLAQFIAEKIEIGSEQMPTDDGRTRGVSTISISLKRGGKAAEKAEAPPEPEVKLQAEVTAPPKAQLEARPQSKDEVAPKAKAPPEKEVTLSDLKGVGKKTEDKLREAGYKSLRSIARAKASTLSGKTGLSEKVASKLIDAAKELLK